MNIATQLIGTYNNRWVKRYLSFISQYNQEKVPFYEQHHILPQSLYKDYINLSENKWNYVYLPPRAHHLAHYMLAKLTNHPKMWHAFNSMNRAGYLNSRFYEANRDKLKEINKQIAIDGYNDIDENGFNRHDRRLMKMVETNQKIDEETGLTNFQSINRKGNATKKETGADKVIVEKRQNKMKEVVEDGLTLQQITNKKINETKSNDIDENGFNSFQRAAYKAKETLRNTVDENGISGMKKKTLKRLATLNKLDSYGVSQQQKINLAKSGTYQIRNKEGELVGEFQGNYQTTLKKLKYPVTPFKKLLESKGAYEAKIQKYLHLDGYSFSKLDTYK